ncbi:MAG: hypothetical protein P8Z80_16865 [Pseudolabrys sp.]
MIFVRLLAGRTSFSRGVIAAGLILLGAAGWRAATAAERFPYDQDLLLQARYVGHAKLVPILNVSSDGSATIGLWCRSVRARVQLSGGTMRIEPGPLPQGLPRYQVDGQCTSRRMAADSDTLSALIQVTGWRRRSDRVTLTGPRPLRFQVSNH